jgi:hypothetical protein
LSVPRATTTTFGGMIKREILFGLAAVLLLAQPAATKDTLVFD